MFQRFDEWLGRSPRIRSVDNDPLGLMQEPAEQDVHRPFGRTPSLEPFSPCPVCDGARFVRTEPVTVGTARLTLVCDDCGGRMEI